MELKQKLLISFSGGRTSAYMTWWLLNMWKKRHDYNMIVVFANTGREREETLDFVRSCDRYYGFKTVWVEAVTNPEFGKGVTAKVVDYKTASRNGEPFEQMIKKLGIPNQNFPHCSRELKRNAIRFFMRNYTDDQYKQSFVKWSNEQGVIIQGRDLIDTCYKYTTLFERYKKEMPINYNYFTAIGIRSDEIHRINWENAKKEKLIYPLVTETRVVKSDINLHWSKQPFDLQLESFEGNCKDCWKKSQRKLLTLAVKDPHLFDWTTEMENLYGEYVPETRTECATPIRFFRNNMTAAEIIEESKLPFTPARDESKDIDKWKQSAFWDIELDTNAGCSESCEAF